MSPKQYKILSKIKKAGIYEFGKSSEDEQEVVAFWGEHGYIKYIPAGDDEPVFTPPYYCRITQEGQAAQYEWKVDKIYRFVPITISILALMKSYGWGIDDIITLCIRLLTQSMK